MQVLAGRKQGSDAGASGAPSLLVAHGDPALSRALCLIHTRYAEPLDVDLIAKEAGVSRTVLGERFARLLGEPPMRYCARWRLRMAATMLLEGGNAGQVAYAVGFHS